MDIKADHLASGRTSDGKVVVGRVISVEGPQIVIAPFPPQDKPHLKGIAVVCEPIRSFGEHTAVSEFRARGELARIERGYDRDLDHTR